MQLIAWGQKGKRTGKLIFDFQPNAPHHLLLNKSQTLNFGQEDLLTEPVVC